jgi:hypothetical protein
MLHHLISIDTRLLIVLFDIVFCPHGSADVIPNASPWLREVELPPPYISIVVPHSLPTPLGRFLQQRHNFTPQF